MLFTSIAVIACAHLAALAPEEGPKAQLKRAGQLLRGPGEEVVRSGAQLCLKLNSVASMELLLDTMNGDQPHYRDIAWETLPDFTDPYARQRVELELNRNKKNDRVRQWCAQALGRYGVVDFGASLERALTDDKVYVRTAAIESIGLVKHTSAIDKIVELSMSKEPRERAVAVEALARLDAEGQWPRFESSLADLDGGARCYILGCAPALYPDRYEALSARYLTDPDWRPRMQAVENLCGAKTKTAVDALVEATADGRPVVARRATLYLQKISGMKFTTKPEWQTWWTANRETFQFPEGDAPAASVEGETGATYNGMPVVSDHVAFVIDRSPSMGGKSSTGETKEERAAKEFEQTLTRLQGQDFRFNTYTYGGPLRTFEKEPVALDKKTQKQALAFVEGVRLSGAKDIWGALEEIVSDPTLDTIYMLSSGEPEVGVYVHWNRVTEHLKVLNRFHKVTIHCVGYTNSDWYLEQLEHISKCTGGEFKACP